MISPRTLKRKGVGAVTRGEYTRIVSNAQHANALMTQVYEQFDKLCDTILKAGGSIPESVFRDIHEEVFQPLLQKQLETT